jgi:ATP-binding protein involved in chromosome partitioning
MFNFVKRKKLLKTLKNFKSAVLKERFENFLKMVRFEKDSASLIFETPKKAKQELESFEDEVKNIAKLSGFKENCVSIIVSSTKSPEPIYEPLKGIKRIMCVASCKGGVGKSTVAINLAKDYAEKGLKVGLLDADIYGPSIPIMLNISNEELKTINGKLIPIEKEGISVISMGFLVKNEDALMWRGAMITKTLRSLFEGVLWGELDVLVVDLPPGTGDVYISLLTNYQVSGVLLVSSPHLVSLEEMKKTIQLFKKFNVKILGVVENMIENGDKSSEFEFKAERQKFKKEGYVRLNLNFAETLK